MSVLIFTYTQTCLLYTSWEHKNSHEKHLSVLDYKKQEREKEIAVLDNKLAEKQDEFRVMVHRIENFDNGERALQNLDESIMTVSYTHLIFLHIQIVL